VSSHSRASSRDYWKGGEIGVAGVGATVANAVFKAMGKRVRDLPITLDKVM
jgi:xanthine dehydrogenase YagR molybdenum-binding subunit